MRFRTTVLAAAFVALSSAGITAQERGVTRRAYPFFADNLTIEVHTESPGLVRFVRGGTGQLEVTGRSTDGVTAFGLGRENGEKLRLTAVGSGRAEFVIVLPERVSVTLWLPGNTSPVLAGLDDAGRFSWQATQRPADPPASAEPRSSSASLTSYALPTPDYVAQTSPHVVSIPEPANVRRLSVRIEGDDFRVGSSIPLRTIPGNAERLEIRTSGPPIDLVLQLPHDVAGFMLKVGSDVAFAVNDGDARALCSPVVSQHVADGRKWFDFTPRDGRLRCQP
jgi:hypothetical protein